MKRLSVRELRMTLAGLEWDSCGFLCASRPRTGGQPAIKDGFLSTPAPSIRCCPHLWRKAGIRPLGYRTYELADGSMRQYRFGAAQFEFLGEITVGRVIFGPEKVEPILGATALESAGILVDATYHTVKRLPAISLK